MTACCFVVVVVVFVFVLPIYLFVTCFLLFVAFVLCLFLSCFSVLCLFLCCFCVFFWSVLICSFCFIMLINVVVFLCLDFVIVYYLSTPHVGVKLQGPRGLCTSARRMCGQHTLPYQILSYECQDKDAQT